MKKVIKISLLLLCSLSFSSNANLLIANKAIENSDFTTAQKHLENIATIGNGEAQLTLGLLHYQGKTGKVDKLTAFAWLFLAAEQKIDNAGKFANQVYLELTAEQKISAKALATEYGKKYSELALFTAIYPLILDKNIERQLITQPAKELVNFELRQEDAQYLDKLARARKANANQTAELIAKLNTGYRHNAYDNLDKLGLEDESGLVIIQHDVNKSGKVVDPEVLFSWPIDRFDDVIIKSVLKSEFSPALRNEKSTEQFGLVTERRVGVHGKNSFRNKYPQRYKYFLKIKKSAQEDINAKYIYANILRAYGDVIGAKQTQTFQQVLKELAQDNYALAQYDYAQYLIYQEGNIDLGLYWLTKAVKFGLTKAEYRFGDLLYQSPSPLLLEDKEKALFWLSRAAAKGHEKAQEKLVLLTQ
ncbi:MAG: hypothetical protein ACSHW0_12035 [Thalassotalea sp.]